MTTPGDESRTELAWREIVEHYGERPVLDEDARRAPQPAAEPRVVEQDEPADVADDADATPTPTPTPMPMAMTSRPSTGSGHRPRRRSPPRAPGSEVSRGVASSWRPRWRW